MEEELELSGRRMGVNREAMRKGMKAREAERAIAEKGGKGKEKKGRRAEEIGG